MERGGRNHAIHKENSIKECPGTRTRISSQEIGKASAIPMNVRTERRKLYTRAFIVCGVPYACCQPFTPHSNPPPSGATLKLFKARYPNGINVTLPTNKIIKTPSSRHLVTTRFPCHQLSTCNNLEKAQKFSSVLSQKFL